MRETYVNQQKSAPNRARRVFASRNHYELLPQLLHLQTCHWHVCLTVQPKGSTPLLITESKKDQTGKTCLVFLGAGGGGRTRTVSPPMDFESTSSANSNTPANISQPTGRRLRCHYILLFLISSSRTLDADDTERAQDGADQDDDQSDRCEVLHREVVDGLSLERGVALEFVRHGL